MTEDFLKVLREESQKEISRLKIYNEYARLRNRLAEEEKKKKKLGLPYRSDLWMPEKTEDSIIVSTYKKHIGEIDEEDTNGIYYYDGTYKYVFDSVLKAYGLGPTEEKVARDDPEADFRRYSNVEGIYSYTFGLKEADEFEKTHTVLYVPEADENDSSLYRITNDFVTTAVREGQEKAMRLLLTKYNTTRK